MSTEYKGSLTLGQILPLPTSAQLALDATLGDTVPDVQARIAGLLEITVRPPPALADLIAAAQNLLSALQALLAAPLPDVAATATALADLQLTLQGLNVRVALSLQLGDFLSSAGVHYYVFNGKASQVGPELAALLSTGLPGGTLDQSVAGCFLLASDGGAITALRAVLKS